MNSRLVGERIRAYDRLVRRHRHTDDGAQQATATRQLSGVHARTHPKELLAGMQRHHHFFERGIARPLPDPVDGTLDLPCPGPHTRKAVRDRHAEVVVAVSRDDYAVRARYLLTDPGDNLTILFWCGVAHGVRDVEGCGPFLDHRCEHVVHILRVGAHRIHRRELDVLAQ